MSPARLDASIWGSYLVLVFIDHLPSAGSGPSGPLNKWGFPFLASTHVGKMGGLSDEMRSLQSRQRKLRRAVLRCRCPTTRSIFCERKGELWPTEQGRGSATMRPMPLAFKLSVSVILVVFRSQTWRCVSIPRRLRACRRRSKRPRSVCRRQQLRRLRLAVLALQCRPVPTWLVSVLAPAV
jgi:hypothetical protein